MSYANPVIIHQGQTAPSVSSRYSASTGSYPSSNASYTPRSMSPTDEEYLRVYGAGGSSKRHQASAKGGRSVKIVNRQQSGYEHGAPTPEYDNGWAASRR